MSWSVAIPSTSAEEFDSAVDALTLPDGTPPPSPEALQQLAAAKVVAKELLASGCIGSSANGPFTVSLVGHANAEHMKTPGYANDMVYVQIAQTYVPPTE